MVWGGPPRGGIRVADHRDFRLEAQALLDELVAVAVRAQRIDGETVRMARDDVERAVSDRARGTEQGKSFLHISFSS